MDGAEIRKEFIYFSEADTGKTVGQWNSISKTVSKMQKMFLGLYKENVGQRSVGPCSWAVKVRLITVMRSVMWGLTGCYCLDVVSVPIMDAMPIGSLA